MNITIKIGAIGDPCLFPHIKPKLVAQITGVGILEAGMVGGGTSLMFLADSPHGYVAMEVSAAMLDTINAAAQGACARFRENAKRN